MPVEDRREPAGVGPNHPLVREYLSARRHSGARSSIALEGYWAVSTARSAGLPVTALFVLSDLAEREPARTLVQEMLEEGDRVVAVSSKLFRRMVDRDGPDGLAALVQWRPWSLADIALDSFSRVLVVDRPDRPGNLGSMIRTADGAGAAGVIVTDSVLPLTSQAVIKASMGTLFSLPTVNASSAEVLRWLRDHRFRTVTAEPEGEHSYRDALYRPPVALVVGNERYGLSSTWSQAANSRVAIPMHGRADSLNVTSAATLLLYEALEQISGAGEP